MLKTGNALVCLIAAVIVMGLLLSETVARERDKLKGEWWIRAYGRVLPSEDPEVEHAEAVFKKLCRTLQPEMDQSLRLIVVPDSAEKWMDSWALSLVDGSVIVVRKLLAFSSGEGTLNRKTTDARLSFILGHELAHLVHKDHQRLGPALVFRNLEDPNRHKETREAEHRADLTGLFLMTMAGMEPQAILESSHLDFFLQYEAKIRDTIRSIKREAGSEAYPEVRQRSRELKARVVAFTEKIKLFHSGVLAFENRRYQAAEKAFNQFLRFFPSREVYNNLGLTKLEIARERTRDCLDPVHGFFLSTRLSYTTRAEKLITAEPVTPITEAVQCHRDDVYRRLLNEAEAFLNLAHQKDMSYFPAVLNLSALSLLKGEYQKAIRYGQMLRNTESYKVDILNNKAVGLYCSDAKNGRSKAQDLWNQIPENAMNYNRILNNIRFAGKAEKGSVGNKSSMNPLAEVQPGLQKKLKQLTND